MIARAITVLLRYLSDLVTVLNCFRVYTYPYLALCEHLVVEARLDRERHSTFVYGQVTVSLPQYRDFGTPSAHYYRGYLHTVAALCREG